MAIDRYAHESAFWTSGSASPISVARSDSAWAATSGERPRRAIDERHRGDGRAHEAPLPPRRRDGQLLELGPAVGLGEDALAVRVGQVVDRDPVVGLGGGTPEELPRALGLAGQGPLEGRDREPARLSLGSRSRRSHTGSSSAGDARRDAFSNPFRRRPGAACARRGSGRSRARRTPGRRGTRDRRARRRPPTGAPRTRPGSAELARELLPELRRPGLARGEDRPRVLARGRPGRDRPWAHRPSSRPVGSPGARRRTGACRSGP